jgi:hypothetical protein
MYYFQAILILTDGPFTESSLTKIFILTSFLSLKICTRAFRYFQTVSHSLAASKNSVVEAKVYLFYDKRTIKFRFCRLIKNKKSTKTFLLFFLKYSKECLKPCFIWSRHQPHFPLVGEKIPLPPHIRSQQCPSQI